MSSSYPDTIHSGWPDNGTHFLVIFVWPYLGFVASLFCDDLTVTNISRDTPDGDPDVLAFLWIDVNSVYVIGQWDGVVIRSG